MDKLISETFEKRKEISELKASVEEDRATCLAVSATAQENISKTENSLIEKIQLVNKEIQQKEKKFHEMLEKATDDVERKNDKLVESVLNLDQNAEIKSLENQLLKFDNRFTRENEIIRKKLEKHNRRISEKTEIALEKLSFKVEEVDDKMTKEKFLLSSEIEKLAETIKDQQKSMSELKEEQYLLNLETTGKSSALGTLEKSYNELQAAFIHLGSRVQQKMNQTIINMSTNHRNYQRYNNEKIDELRDKLSEIIANHNLQGQRVRENSNLTMKLFLNEHMLNRTQSHQGYQLLQLAQEAKRCTDETDNIIRKFNEQQAQLQSQKDEMRDLRTILLQEAAEVRAEKENVEARGLQNQINEAHKRIDGVHERFLAVRNRVDKEDASILTLSGALNDLQNKAIPALEDKMENILKNSATKAELHDVIEQMSKLKETQETLKKTVLNQNDLLRNFQKSTLDSQTALSKEFEERLDKLEDVTSKINEDFATFNQEVRHKITNLDTLSTQNAAKMTTLEETDNSYHLRLVQQQLRTSQRDNEVLKKKIEALERQVDPVLLAFGDDPREKIRQICQQEMMRHGVIDSYSRGRN